MRLGYLASIASCTPSGQGASMRPRRMRLGYLRGQRQPRLVANCFNEAEAHAPRILIQNQSTFYLCPSFNEAEAHAPRIHVIGAGGNGSIASFNEAEAHAPRIPRSRFSARKV